MAEKTEGLEGVFRRYFPDFDPENRDEVVVAYATARSEAGRLYQRLMREVGGRGKFTSAAEERKIRAALREHKEFPVYAAATEKRDSAVRLIDSWGEEAGNLLEKHGVDPVRFKGDARFAKSAAEPAKSTARPQGANRNVLNFPGANAASDPARAEAPPARGSVSEVVSPAQGDLAEWYHAGAVIELSGGRRIAVVQGWSESRAVVVALGEGKEVPVDWTRRPSPSDRMALSLNPLVRNDVTAGDFGFIEASVEPTVETGSIVQPIDVHEERHAAQRGEWPSAAHKETSDAVKADPFETSRTGFLGAPGEPIDASRLGRQPSHRPFSRLAGAGAAVGLIVLSVGTFSFLGNSHAPDGARSAALTIGSMPPDAGATERNDVRTAGSGVSDTAGRTKETAEAGPGSGMTAAPVAGHTARQDGASTENPISARKLQAHAGASVKPDAGKQSEGHLPARHRDVNVPGHGGSGATFLAPGTCLPAKVEVVIGGQKVMASTAGCVRVDGQVDNDGGSRRVNADLRGYETALAAAERRIGKAGLTREQARMLREGAEGDPRKQAMLASHPGVAEAVEILSEPRASTRENIVR